MENPPDPTEDVKVDLIKSATKAFSTAFRTIVIGGIVSFLLILLAVSTLFIEGGDSAGPGFFILGFLALAVFVISCVISLVTSAIGLIKGTIALSDYKNSKDEIRDGITKNITLILGILLMLLIAYKLFT